MIRLALLLAIGCSSPVETWDCPCGTYVIDATQLDGTCGPLAERKTWLDCTMRTMTGGQDIIAESGAPLVLKWEDWYNLDGLVGGCTMTKSSPVPHAEGETGSWGTADAMYGYGQPLCTSHYAFRLTKLE